MLKSGSSALKMSATVNALVDTNMALIPLCNIA